MAWSESFEALVQHPGQAPGVDDGGIDSGAPFKGCKTIVAESVSMNGVMAGMATILLVGLEPSEMRENIGRDEARTASALG